MKVSCLQENLLKGLHVVARAVAARSTLPVLGNILLATDQGRLKLVATNLELTLTTWIGAKVEAEGAITVPARTLVDWVQQMPPERIDMELDAKTAVLRLKCYRHTANIKGITADEFPVIPQVQDAVSVKVESNVLAEGIAQTVFAAASDEARPTLTGVFVEVSKDTLTFAAADGFRLAVRRVETLDTVKRKTTALVPALCLKQVVSVIGGQEDPITMLLTEQRIEFIGSTVRVNSSLVEGAFPKYEKIIPESHRTRMVLDTAELKNAISASDVFAREALHTVRFKIAEPGEMGECKVTVSATSAESGDSTCDIECTVDGGPVEIALDSRYLKDALGAVHVPQVAFELTDGASPAVIKPVGYDTYTQVIMPMHIGT